MKNALFICTLLFLNYSFCQSRSNLKANTKAPKINITDWILNTPKNKDLKDKVVVLEFWATWCAPCIKALPHLNKVQEKINGNNEIIFLSISNEKVNTIEEKLDKIKFNSIVATDTTNQTNKNFGVNFIPLTVVINKENIVKWIGNPLELNSELLNDIIDNKSIDKKYSSETDLFSIKNKNQVYTNINHETFKKLIQNKSIDYYYSLKETTGKSNVSLKVNDNIFSYSAITLKKLLAKIYNINYNNLIIPKELEQKKYEIAYKNNRISKRNTKLEEEILQQLGLKKETYKRKKVVFHFKLKDETKLLPTSHKGYSSFTTKKDTLILKKQTIESLFKIIEHKTNHIFILKTPSNNEFYDFEIDMKNIDTIKESFMKYGFSISEKKTNVKIIEIKQS